MSGRREYDIVIFGATGYTGRLIVNYLVKHGPKDVTWALAGRNMGSLKKVASNHSIISGLLQGDTTDTASLDRICESCKIVLSVAGPYSIHGPPLVEACLRAGTHYMDLTGELAYLRWIVDQHDTAVEKGVALVSGCGFDSIPSDLGNLLIHDFAAENGESVEIVHSYYQMQGGDTPSGGTAASMGAGRAAMLSVDHNPLSINPYSHRTGVIAPTRRFMNYNSTLGCYAAPFLMATGNERIVRRSNCLNGYPMSSYGEQAMGGFFESIKHTIMWWAVAFALSVYVVRVVLLRCMPAPGEGPTEAQKANDFFKATFLGSNSRLPGTKPRYSATVAFKGNPYDATAVLAVEAAVVLLRKSTVKGGALTPAACMGMDLVRSLRTKGFTMTVQKL